MLWAFWTGTACLAAATVGGLLTITAAGWSFWTISQTSKPPRPENLADRISIAVIAGSAILPLLLAGLLLLAVGFVRSATAKRQS